MKIGLNVSIDVSKIDKARLYKGKKGTYLDLTTFIDTNEVDQYDNNGFISQSTSKEERQFGVQTPILGNVKVFYSDDKTPGQNQPQPGQNNAGGNASDFDDDMPFMQHDRFLL